ncbi:MAG TPA: YbhB/YbcL family Raf kinase inhibitor-like protein [Rhodoferax sp.]|nr:YbhB/YbcL family Raf kinase inhibitor-like protein [Rhodoferax sp.]
MKLGIRGLTLAVGIIAAVTSQAQTPAFTLSSSDLASGTFANKFVLNGFGCKGDNVSPALQWSNVPPGTKSLALQVYDPDAPTGSGFWHWAVYNIPASVSGLAQGAGNGATALPPGAFGGNTDFMDTGATGGNGNYGGPCPPTGDKPHRYIFTLFALAVPQLEVAGGVPKTGTAGLFGFVLNKGVGPALLGKASFTATYGR